MRSSGNWSLPQRQLYGPRVVRRQHVAFVAGAKPENIKYCNGESARNENERRSHAYQVVLSSLSHPMCLAGNVRP